MQLGFPPQNWVSPAAFSPSDQWTLIELQPQNGNEGGSRNTVASVAPERRVAVTGPDTGGFGIGAVYRNDGLVIGVAQGSSFLSYVMWHPGSRPRVVASDCGAAVALNDDGAHFACVTSGTATSAGGQMRVWNVGTANPIARSVILPPSDGLNIRQHVGPTGVFLDGGRLVAFETGHPARDGMIHARILIYDVAHERVSETYTLPPTRGLIPEDRLFAVGDVLVVMAATKRSPHAVFVYRPG